MPLNDSKVVKDIAGYFNFTICKYLDNIDELKDNLDSDCLAYRYINDLLHRIFIRINSKLEKKEIVDYKNIKKKIDNIIPYQKKKFIDDEKEIRMEIVTTKQFRYYIELTEEREIIINSFLERIGLTSKEDTGAISLS